MWDIKRYSIIDSNYHLISYSKRDINRIVFGNKLLSTIHLKQYKKTTIQETVAAAWFQNKNNN